MHALLYFLWIDGLFKPSEFPETEATANRPPGLSPFLQLLSVLLAWPYVP
jgi:hypothetical protein